MGDLVPRDYYDPVPAKRQTRKELSRIEQQAIVKLAALEAAARDAQFQLEAREHLALGEALLRVKGTYDLTHFAERRATQLNHSIALESNGNPRLEQIHRRFEETAAITAEQVIYHYGTGDR
jgi:hypothetical protein